MLYETGPTIITELFTLDNSSNSCNQYLGTVQSASVVTIHSKLAICTAVLMASFLGELYVLRLFTT